MLPSFIVKRFIRPLFIILTLHHVRVVHSVMGTSLVSPDQYTIGWIAPLSIERAAATALLDERHDAPKEFEQHQTDRNSYTWGRMSGHNIVIASLPAGSQGSVPAATTTTGLLSSLPHIRIGLLVGIASGVARPHQGQDIRLGDVVVSQPYGILGGVIQYDKKKATLDDSWEMVGSLNMPPQVLLHALSSIQADHEINVSQIPELLEAMWTAYPNMAKPKKAVPGYVHQGFEHDRLFLSTYSHGDSEGCKDCDSRYEVARDTRGTPDPEVHYGIIASGNTELADGTSRDAIVDMIGGDCMSIDMEAAGLMNHFPCLVVRGICDYADSHKSNRWHRYASATAAAYAKELLSFVPIRDLAATARAIDILQSGELSHHRYVATTTKHLSVKGQVETIEAAVSTTKGEVQDMR